MENQSIQSNTISKEPLPQKSKIIKGTCSFEMVDCGINTEPLTEVINSLHLPIVTSTPDRKAQKQEY